MELSSCPVSWEISAAGTSKQCNAALRRCQERGGTTSAELGSHGRRSEVQALVDLIAEPEAEGRQLDADGKLRRPALTSAQLGA